MEAKTPMAHLHQPGPLRLLHQRRSYPDSGFRHYPKHSSKTSSTTFHCWSPDRGIFSGSKTRHYNGNKNGVHKESRGIYFLHFSCNIWVIPIRYLGDTNIIPGRYPGGYIVTWARLLRCEPVFAPCGCLRGREFRVIENDSQC